MGGAEALDMILRDITNDSPVTKSTRRTTMDPEEMDDIMNTLNESNASEASTTSVSFPSIAQSPVTRSAAKNRRTTIDPADLSGLLQSLDDSTASPRPDRNKRRETVDPADMGSLLDAINDSSNDSAENGEESSVFAVNTPDANAKYEQRTKLTSNRKNRRTTMDPDELENIMNDLDHSHASDQSLVSRPRAMHSAAQQRKRRETIDPDDLNGLLENLNDSEDCNITEAVEEHERSADVSLKFAANTSYEDCDLAPVHSQRRETIDPTELETVMNDLKKDVSGSSPNTEQDGRDNRRQTINPADMDALMEGLNDSVHDDTQSMDVSSLASEQSCEETHENDIRHTRHHTINPTDLAGAAVPKVPVHTVSNRRHTISPVEVTREKHGPIEGDTQETVVRVAQDDDTVESMCMQQVLQFDESIDTPYLLSNRRQTADPMDMMSLLRNLEKEQDDSIVTPGASSPKRRETADPAAIAVMLRELQASGDRRLTADAGEIASIIDQLENSAHSDRSDVSTNTVALMSSVKRLLLEHESPNVSTTDDTVNTQDLLASVRNIVHDMDVNEEDDKFEDTIESVGSLGGLLNMSLDDRPAPKKSCMSTHKPSAQKKSVVFGSPNAAEFNSASPITSFTPLHPSMAKSLFPMTAPEPTEADLETLENYQMLAPFEEELSRMSTPPSSRKRRGRATARSSSSKKRRESIVHTLDAEFASQSDDSAADVSRTEVLPDTLAELMTQNGLFSPVQSPVSDVALSRIIHPSGVDLDQSSVSHTEVLETDLNALMRHLHRAPVDSSSEHEEYTLDGLLPRDQDLDEEEESSAAKSDESEVSFRRNNSYVSHHDESFTQELEFDLHAMMENCGENEEANLDHSMDISYRSQEPDDASLYLESRLGETQPENVSDSSMDTSVSHDTNNSEPNKSMQDENEVQARESNIDLESPQASSFSGNTSLHGSDQSESTMVFDESNDIIVTENVEMSTIAAKTTPAVLRKIRRLNNDAHHTILEHCQAPLATNVSMSMRNFNFAEAYNQSIEEAMAVERAEAQRKADEQENAAQQQEQLSLLKEKIAQAKAMQLQKELELAELRSKTKLLKDQEADSKLDEEIEDLRTSIDIVNTLSYCTIHTFKSNLIVVDCYLSASSILSVSYQMTAHRRKPAVNHITYTLSGNSDIAEMYLDDFMLSSDREGPLSPNTLKMISHPSQICIHMKHVRPIQVFFF